MKWLRSGNYSVKNKTNNLNACLKKLIRGNPGKQYIVFQIITEWDIK